MFCYRHPDREAYVRCQRCERLICPECQVEASVGFLCVDDAGPQVRPSRIRTSIYSGRPVVTQALIAINVVIFGLQVFSAGMVTDYLYYAPYTTLLEPWRMITSGFVHSDNLFTDPASVLHILLNMYTLYLFGQVLEPMLGKARFLALYLLSILGGSVAVLWFAGPTQGVLGASGGVFGLMGAYFVVMRTLGGNSSTIMGVIAFNLIFTFLNPGVSWQAHVGGLILGGLVAFVYSRTRGAHQQNTQILGLVGVSLALVLVSAYKGYEILAQYGMF
jgi:membrane associated rhomboid family serine protease